MTTQAPVREAVPTRPGTDVFISYSRRDREVVERLTAALEDRGRSAWVDFADIPPTAEWMAEIRGAIDAADTVVVVLSPDSVASPVCTEELQVAVDANKRIVPVVVRDPGTSDVPPELAKRNWLFLREGDDFEAGVDSLVITLETDLEATRFHTGLLVKAREWEQASEPKSRLLRGSDLTEAESYVANPSEGPAATQEQTSFVLASRKAASRRQRGIVVGISLALAFSMVLAGLAIVQRGTAIRSTAQAEAERQRADSRALAAQALTKLGTEPDLGMLLAIEAQRAAPTPEAANAVQVAVQETIWMRGILRGHADEIFGLAFSADGQLLASSSADGTVRIWDVETGELVVDPLPVGGNVLSIEFSPDGEVLAAGASDGSLLIWETQSWRPVRTLRGPTTGWVSSLTFAPDGKTMASTYPGGRVVLWRTADWKEIGHLRASEGIYQLRFSSNGQFLASANANGTVDVWNPTTRKLINELHAGTTDDLLSLEFSPDQRLLTAGDNKGNISVWLTRDWHLRRVLTGPYGQARSLSFGPESRQLLAATGPAVVLWDLARGTQIGTPLRGHKGFVNATAFSPDGLTIASAGEDGAIVLWTTTGDYLEGVTDLDTHNETLTDRAKIAVAIEGKGQLVWWTPPDGSRLGALSHVVDGYGTELAVSPDASLLAVGSTRGEVRFLDWASGERIGSSRRTHDGYVTDIAFSPDGELAASGSSDKTVIIWDTTTGKPIGPPIKGHRSSVMDLAFSPDGSVLATAGWEGSVRLWDPRTGLQVTPPMEQPGHVESLAFSPDSTLLATGNSNGSVSFWDPRSGEHVGSPLRGHLGEVFALVFGPDSDLLASASLDGQIIIWDVKKGRAIGAGFSGHADNGVHDMAFDDRGWLVSLGFDTRVVRWDPRMWADPDDLLARLCSLADRDMTHEEWRTFLPSQPYRRSCAA